MDSETEALVEHLRKTIAYLLEQYKKLQNENELLKEKIRSFYG